MRLALFAALASLAAIASCSGNGSLKSPRSDCQYDDGNDPGSGCGTGGGGTHLADAGATLVALPDGPPGVGFDDLRFSGALGRVLVPAGRTGDVDLVDPSSLAVTVVSGFSATAQYTQGSHADGPTSADEGGGMVYAIDRTATRLDVVDPTAKKIVASAALAAAPDYVRFVAAAAHEVWVSEPGAQQIEVFAVGSDATSPPVHAAVIAVPAAPESLEIDAAAGRAYTNAAGSTFQMDAAKHAVSATWANGCTTARGLAVDSAHGWIVVACDEGVVSVLDAKSGAKIGAATLDTQGASGVDAIAYDPQRTRVYAPAPSTANVYVVDLGPDGKPTTRGSLGATGGVHCAATSGASSVFVCDPAHGGLLVLHDGF